MGDKLQVLEEKVDQLVRLVEKLRADNAAAKTENTELRTELSRVRSEVARLRLNQNDHSQDIKDRLQILASHLQELEQISQ